MGGYISAGWRLPKNTASPVCYLMGKQRYSEWDRLWDIVFIHSTKTRRHRPPPPKKRGGDLSLIPPGVRSQSLHLAYPFSKLYTQNLLTTQRRILGWHTAPHSLFEIFCFCKFRLHNSCTHIYFCSGYNVCPILYYH